MPDSNSKLIETECPCCEAVLKVDTETGSVISFVEKEKPRTVEDLNVAVQKLKGESARREETFQKQMAEQKTHKQVLNRKFEELLKQAKEAPDLTPRTKDIDLD
jgi:hypothetical protein